MPIQMHNMRDIFISNNNTCNDNPATTNTAQKRMLPSRPAVGRFIKSIGGSIRRGVGSASLNSNSTQTTAISPDVSDSSESVSAPVIKSVSFAARASLHPTLARSEYTAEERCAAFFQSEDYSQITIECVKQVRKMENGEELKDKKYCSRGLEAHTRLAAISKRENRQAAYSAVLDEQEDQWTQQEEHQANSSDNSRSTSSSIDYTIDDERIARAYISVSSSCHMWASVVGLRDQKAAEDYLLSVDG